VGNAMNKKKRRTPNHPKPN